MTDADSTRPKSCEHCLATFTSIIAKARYCCGKCQRAHYRQTHKHIKNHGPYTCKQCTLVFYRDNDRRTTFCSRECNFANRKLIKLLNENRQLTKIVVRREVRSLVRIAKSVSERTASCNFCGDSFIRRIGNMKQFCSDECRRSQHKENTRKARSTPAARARKAMHKSIARGCNGGDRIDPIKVFERDKWRCHLCGSKTPKALRGTTDGRAPELEHIVSIADGGSHTWGNVACSCRQCNQAKGSSSFGQLGFGFAA